MKLPFDIMLETVISAVIVLWSFVQMTVKLKNIRPEAEYEKRTVESLDFRPSFMVFGQKQSLYKLRLLDQKTRLTTETPFPIEESTSEQTSPLVEDDLEMTSIKD
ncbi:hypothetical protein RvY_07751 [Ramazzottius varieornatus]|uniref:Uncharacterized protein n=1 Tax=Ramazzottius varieornatus TaxID=947166 RepID=A0A1D1VBM9_RAMVA|nr:hypothetical protein RvY_07751 [Ramazzottius varieornatus]